MIKQILLVTAFAVSFLFYTKDAFAVSCNTDIQPNGGCGTGEICVPIPPSPNIGECQKDIFGRISPPPQLRTGPTGSGAISDFLSRLVILIYSIAAIAFIFMLLWGAFEWLTSGGDKEKIASARHRIMNAIIGIILFAVAFAIIRVIGTFTGFTFFTGQNSLFCPGGSAFTCF